MQLQENWRRLLLRTEETAAKYEAAQREPQQVGCKLCNDLETIYDFTHWRLMPNAFPYDKYFSKSIMLVTKRHTDEANLSTAELMEFRDIKKSNALAEYDTILEQLPKRKSIPHHLHYHIVTIRRSE